MKAIPHFAPVLLALAALAREPASASPSSEEAAASSHPFLRELAVPVPQSGLYHLDLDPELQRQSGRGAEHRLMRRRGDELVEVPLLRVTEDLHEKLSERTEPQTLHFPKDALHFRSPPPSRDQDPPLRREVNLPILETSTAAKGVTRLLIDCGNLPLDQIELTPRNRNFRRAVSLQVSLDREGQSWRTLARAHLHHYEIGDWRDASLILYPPQFQAERARLLVENGDNAPIEWCQIVGRGPVERRQFLAEAGDQLLLYFGADPGETTDIATHGELDTAPVAAAHRRGIESRPLEWCETRDNPHYQGPKVSPLPTPLRTRCLLWGMIALAVGGLAWALYRAMLEIDRAEDHRS